MVNVLSSGKLHAPVGGLKTRLVKLQSVLWRSYTVQSSAKDMEENYNDNSKISPRLLFYEENTK